MKIFLFLTEDPYYTEDLVYNIISRPNSKVVGAIASQSQPNIKQVFVGKIDSNQTEKDFLLKL